MLHGSAAMRLLVLDRGHDADLRIAPTHAFYVGSFAQTRSLAVGGDPQLACSRAAVCPLHLNVERRRRKAGDTIGSKDRDGWLTRERGTQRAGEVGVLDHICAGFARSQIVGEPEEMRTKRRIERAVG